MSENLPTAPGCSISVDSPAQPGARLRTSQQYPVVVPFRCVVNMTGCNSASGWQAQDIAIDGFRGPQMKHFDPHVRDVFRHLRAAIDALEAIAVRSREAPIPEPKNTAVDTTSTTTPRNDPKLAYTIKEACGCVGISRTLMYQAIRNKELRAVKCNHRTLILANDLKAWIEGLRASAR
jgi:excisionase family DNA binding protein